MALSTVTRGRPAGAAVIAVGVGAVGVYRSCRRCRGHGAGTGLTLVSDSGGREPDLVEAPHVVLRVRAGGETLGRIRGEIRLLQTNVLT